MEKLIAGMFTATARTDNDAVTHKSSLDYLLDLFFIAGASRNMAEDAIISMFSRAHAVDKNLAYKILFWARDCRGGAGERRFFHVVSRWLEKYHKEDWEQLVIHVDTFGYWKDIFQIDTPSENVLNYLWTQLNENPNANLLAKWFPRKGPWFVEMHKYLNVSPKEFRKLLVRMSNTVETQMCARNWEAVEYSKVPSVAMNRYRGAFQKHDENRFSQYIQDVLDGKQKINADVLYPHELYQAIKFGQDHNAVEAQWRALPNFMEGSEERILPMCDVSGSMDGLPMDVSVALGLYIAERNEGPFKDYFLTFSADPELQRVAGDTLANRMYSLSNANWGMNTDLVAAFEQILQVACRDKLTQAEMPTKILVLSDMEFDHCGSSTNFDAIRFRYEENGYKLPEIVFWNLNARQGNVPVQSETPGVALVSGFSPSILKSVLKGEILTPLDIMMQTVCTERYARIQVV